MHCPLPVVSSINHQNLPMILLHHTEWLLSLIVNDFLKIQNHDMSLYLHSLPLPKLALVVSTRYGLPIFRLMQIWLLFKVQVQCSFLR